MYVLNISEQAFPTLKQEQRLRVDFADFSAKVVELFNKCNEIDAVGSAVTAVGPPSPSPNVSSNGRSAEGYYARLDQDYGSFAIVQANAFNELIHISLTFRAANDMVLKSYLVSRLLYYSTRFDQSQEQAKAFLEQLNDEKAQRIQLTNDIREVK